MLIISATPTLTEAADALEAALPIAIRNGNDMATRRLLSVLDAIIDLGYGDTRVTITNITRLTLNFHSRYAADIYNKLAGGYPYAAN